MEEATKKALNLLEQSAMFAKEFIEKHGPQAWDTVLWVYTISGIHNLIVGITSIIAAYIGYRCSRTFFAKAATYNEYDDGRLGYGLATGFTACVTTVFIGMAVVYLLNVWTYVAVFKPELAVARDVFNKVTK